MSVNTIIKFLVAFAALTYVDSASQYIHSNDTFSMVLSPGMSNQLTAAPGSVRALEFVLTNNYQGGHFMFRQFSEDNFEGNINPEARYVDKGMMQTIVVEQMKVPNRSNGEKVKFTLTVIKYYSHI